MSADLRALLDAVKRSTVQLPVTEVEEIWDRSKSNAAKAYTDLDHREQETAIRALQWARDGAVRTLYPALAAVEVTVRNPPFSLSERVQEKEPEWAEGYSDGWHDALAAVRSVFYNALGGRQDDRQA